MKLFELRTRHGARCRLQSSGAHILSWQPAHGPEQLFLSRQSGIGSGVPVRGGIPIVFPQFADLGKLPKHGLVRQREWQFRQMIQAADEHSCLFTIADDERTRAVWPHRFQLEYAVCLRDNSLQLTLSVENRDQHDWSFQSALHSYFGLGLGQAQLTGLQHKPYFDRHRLQSMAASTEPQLVINSSMDRIYRHDRGLLQLQQQGACLSIKDEGFANKVIWTPWSEQAGLIDDLAPDEGQRFVCIESANVSPALTLAAGETWRGQVCYQFQAVLPLS